MKTNDYSFGFDIGCASVGWAVVGDSIVELGSNLFSEANPENNQTRRDRRGARRLLRRRKNRIRDFKVQFWNKYVEPKYDNSRASETVEYIDNKFHTPLKNIVEIKNKGLQEKLNLEELYFILINYLKHKGISYLDEEIDRESGDDDTAKKMTDYVKMLSINKEELEHDLPCQIQKSRLEKYGVYRGNNTVSVGADLIPLSNVWTTSSYKSEIEKILKKQSEYFDFINDEFIDEFIKLFERKREYYVGPGNEKSRTDYGIYTTMKNENGTYKTDKNIFSKLIGKCSIYNEKRGHKDDFEYRGSAAGYTAEYFNLLNDLCNVRLDGEKLSSEEKEKIINEIKASDKLGVSGVEKIMRDVVGRKDAIIIGARIDKDNKNIYHMFSVYRKMKKELMNININIDDIDVKVLDKICDILTINTERDAIVLALKESSGIDDRDKTPLNLSDEAIEVLQKFRSKNSSLFTKWHSFSYKIMRQLIPIMLEDGMEQMQALYELV